MKAEIFLAKTAGMCYGVKRAINETEKLIKSGKKAVTFGELIHNNDVINSLAEKGVYAVDKISDCPDGYWVIIRSHSAGRNVYDEIIASGKDYIDASCPDVKKIHRIIAEKSDENANIIIIGDKNHPEVIGIVGHKNSCRGKCFVVNSHSELKNVLEQEKDFSNNILIMAAQTTLDRTKWRDCKKIIKKYYTNVQIFDTICNTTVKRQEEAAELAKKCDFMVVIGANHSSNSKKLADICMTYTKTVFIENASKLDLKKIKVFLSSKTDVKIGITAGASTPAHIIKEVHNIMSEEFKDGVQMTEGDIDFMAEVDKTFKRIYIGNRVRAYVVAVNRTEAVVDVGTKHSGYIPADELSNDSSKLPSDVVKVGDEIDCIVTSINDAEGVVYLSKKRIDAALGLEKISGAFESGAVLDGLVIAVVKGGVIIVYEGARVFVPASQTGVPKNGKLDDLQKKIVKFKVIEVNEARGRVVGSIKAAYKEENDAIRAKFWSEIEEGKKFVGEVKSIESYGVFVDLGGVDGMVHLSELTWNRIKHPREIVSIGDKLNVYVKGFDLEKKRVSLGARDPMDNPWTKFSVEFKPGDTVKVQIVSITPFGAFAQIIPGVDGLIHISQISNERVTNVAQILSIGQVVETQITEIDVEKNRVSLSIKALIEPVAEQGESEDVVVYSDSETVNNATEE